MNYFINTPLMNYIINRKWKKSKVEENNFHMDMFLQCYLQVFLDNKVLCYFKNKILVLPLV